MPETRPLDRVGGAYPTFACPSFHLGDPLSVGLAGNRDRSAHAVFTRSNSGASDLSTTPPKSPPTGPADVTWAPPRARRKNGYSNELLKVSSQWLLVNGVAHQGVAPLAVSHIASSTRLVSGKSLGHKYAPLPAVRVPGAVGSTPLRRFEPTQK